MNDKLKPKIKDHLFHAGHACHFLDIKRRTLYHWLKHDKIKSMKTRSGRHLFALDEINRILELEGKEALTQEDAIRIWERW